MHSAHQPAGEHTITATSSPTSCLPQHSCAEPTVLTSQGGVMIPSRSQPLQSALPLSSLSRLIHGQAPSFCFCLCAYLTFPPPTSPSLSYTLTPASPGPPWAAPRGSHTSFSFSLPLLLRIICPSICPSIYLPKYLSEFKPVPGQFVNISLTLLGHGICNCQSSF